MIKAVAVDDMGPGFVAAMYCDGDDAILAFSTTQPDEVRVPAVNRLLRAWEQGKGCTQTVQPGLRLVV